MVSAWVLVWPWLGAALLAGVVAVVVRAWRTRRRRAEPDRWVANTAYLDQVPALHAALRRHRWMQAAGAGVLAVALVGAGVLAARPADRQVLHERLGTRDIVLCLDVSGSMLPFDSAIAATFAQLVDGFSGERIALSVFDSTSRTVFPLTDDYTLVLQELQTARDAASLDLYDFDNTTTEDLERLLAFVAGTAGVPGEASLIGDGLASCALLFDEQATERARSIVLATDNYVNGEPIYALGEAVDLVSSRQVRIYGLYGGASELRGTPEHAEFDTVITGAGGLTWYAQDPAAIDAMIADVTAAQAVDLDDTPQIRLTDRPHPWFALLLAGVGVLLVLRWRSRT